MKKIILCVFVCLSLCSIPVFAQDELVITNETIQVFIDVFPEYRELIEHAGRNQGMQQAIDTLNRNKEDFLKLLEKYDLTLPEFAALVKKVSVAYTQEKLSQEHANDKMGALFGKIAQMTDISPEEQTVVRNNLAKLATMIEK